MSGGPLTTKQRETLQLIADGLSNDEAASRLHIAVRGVEQRVAAARWVLGANNRVHMIALAIRKGYIK